VYGNLTTSDLLTGDSCLILPDNSKLSLRKDSHIQYAILAFSIVYCATSLLLYPTGALGI